MVVSEFLVQAVNEGEEAFVISRIIIHPNGDVNFIFCQKLDIVENVVKIMFFRTDVVFYCMIGLSLSVKCDLHIFVVPGCFHFLNNGRIDQTAVADESALKAAMKTLAGGSQLSHNVIDYAGIE